MAQYYVIELSADEREALEELMRQGKAAARKLTRTGSPKSMGIGLWPDSRKRYVATHAANL